MEIILASTSPRRAQLLHQAGVCFDVLNAQIDESLHPNESADVYSRRMVLSKAQKACLLLQQQPLSLVLTADTIVVAPAGEILGKPNNQQDAFLMWDKLSGKTHTVLTAVCASVVKNGQIIAQEIISCQTKVTFITLTKVQKQHYWQTGEPIDKAGAYAIQGIGASWVEKINGSYTAVVGLPLPQTLALIHQMMQQYDQSNIN